MDVCEHLVFLLFPLATGSVSLHLPLFQPIQRRQVGQRQRSLSLAVEGMERKRVPDPVAVQSLILPIYCSFSLIFYSFLLPPQPDRPSSDNSRSVFYLLIGHTERARESSKRCFHCFYLCSCIFCYPDVYTVGLRYLAVCRRCCGVFLCNFLTLTSMMRYNPGPPRCGYFLTSFHLVLFPLSYVCVLPLLREIPFQ